MLIFIIQLLVVLACSYTANPSIYSNTSVIYKEMEKLEQQYSSFFKIHKVPQDTNIHYATLGEKTNKVKAILTCGAHARQLLSSEVCIEFLKSITKKWDQYPNLYLVVVPVVNKNRDTVLGGELCLRVNHRGVDPNRNYPTNWQNGGTRNGSDIYRGPHPLSEDFSQFMDKLLASQQKWTSILDIHTGQLTLFYAQVDNKTLNRQTVQLLNKIKRKYCPICIVNTIEHLEGSIAGEMFKYAATKYQVEHPLQFQIYCGNIREKYEGEKTKQDRNNICMKSYSPNNERVRDFYLNRWVRATQNVYELLLELKKDQ